MTLRDGIRRAAGRALSSCRAPWALFGDQEGAAIVLTAFMLPVIAGFAGVGLDLTHWYSERRAMQTMADGAAIAATHAVMEGGDQDAIADAAEGGAEINGWSAAAGYTIETYSPPQGGMYPGLARAAEVRVGRAVPLYFLGMFGMQPVNVTARATGAGVDNGPQCVIALDDTADRAVNFTGNSTVNLGCGVASNSSSNEAIYVGGDATLTANPAQAFGDIYIGNSATLVTQSPVQPFSQRVGDPYDDLIIPVAPATCSETNFWVQTGDDYTSPPLQPGRYCGGLRISGTADLAPGTYIIADGEFEIGSQAVVTGDEVTIVLTGTLPEDVGDVMINGGAEVTLTPPTSGEFAGVLFFQDPDADPGGVSSLGESHFNGNALVNLTGALYFPQRQIEYGGSGSAAGASCLHIVARRVKFTGSADITNDPATCAAFGVEQVNQLRVQLIE